MRYLFILCLLMSPLFAKEVHVKRGWTIVLPPGTLTYEKGTEIEGYDDDGCYRQETLEESRTTTSEGEVRITVQERGGSTVTIPDNMCLTPKRGKILVLEECGGES
ncbi:MAG: hypothetical protein S4CHLAM81_11080 [Chlamydiales bacterium]|nr:hypothetical protein [Chlamydiales bacterium]MCH9635886.1 hypothetical protein [Chlamydiales bacterium]MCH9703332.1 hypothetical protein [Chlamydiota bacterium]